MTHWLETESNRLDGLFNGVFPWLLEQFDPLTGGFYYARSSVLDDRFTPDIESTSQAINILRRHQLLDNMPQTMKEKMIAFFQMRQDAATGYFYDHDPNMKKDEVMVHRALHYSRNSLMRLGASPLYPLPVENQLAPSYTKSLSLYRKKWESIDLRNSWRGSDLLSSSTVYFAEMDEAKQQKYVQTFTEYLAEKQDPETGLWGEGSLYVRISGTFKLHAFYRRYQIPMPNQDRIYQTILHCLREEEAVDMCYIRNPIDLLSYIEPNISKIELREISEITINNMKRLKQKDGAFSRELAHSPKAPNVAQVKHGEYYPNMPEAVELSLGLKEGDMNATTQATLIRKQLHQLWQKQPKPIPTNFWDIGEVGISHFKDKINKQKEV
ncbi:hypothetical protein SAMN04487943_10349 [Gracilibacillus orientalis]|uniref:Uncharacterized protein n=1 Tax=Gracilibacillus orientalis TaxID=334253 RepID=A0A1I4JLW5_9BACI|nr:hypothetical protein [Gracilibacillus orientalis]SFL67562.1 hypothetical protein SAMN04487943_10349 [Gracilibacillus orientalis]